MIWLHSPGLMFILWHWNLNNVPRKNITRTNKTNMRYANFLCYNFLQRLNYAFKLDERFSIMRLISPNINLK